MIGIIALAALVVPTLLVRNAPRLPYRAHRVPPVALPNRVVPKEELPSVEPVAIADLSPDDARAFNAAIPFSTDPNPAARPFHLIGPADSQERALDCLAAAEVYEAGDDALGERAVAQVILNRVRHPAFPKTVCGVVFQGSERSTGCQFTFSCDGALLRWSPTAAAWARARDIAKMALHGAVFRPVGHATHYHTDWVVPYWSASLDKIVGLHTHLFFRWAGWWGTPPAFNRSYVAEEPKIALLGKLSPAHAATAEETDLGSAGDPGATGLLFDVRKAAGAIPASAVPAAVAGDQNVFLVTLPEDMVPDLYPALALRTCGDRPYCKFMAWLDSSKKPPRLPPSGEQAAAMSFSYLRDERVQYVKALWNCDQFRRPTPAQCMRRAPAPAVPKPQPSPGPTPTSEAAPLDGVRRKAAPIQNKAGAAAPASPASSVPSSD
ncbi:cell wall hydrolase [Sphingomonas sp. TDK1]|uniref:cell wall hydrolase n=1 Tax=Sphingomonas sp. TDK1 TaxID=453247 RepID=UPI0007D8F6E6|nr:cell wall hydrolase [Sphingomonas sp. TDK1]OAN59829.1 SleB-like protein [Sphingomonas sp. TDK1]